MFGFEVRGPGFGGSCFGLGLGLRGPGFGLLQSGFGVWGLGFKLRVRAEGLGFRNYG